MFFLFIECIGVILVNKIIQVSGAQFYNTSFVHCMVCSSPQVHHHLFPLYPFLPSTTITTLLSMSMSFFLFNSQFLQPHNTFPIAVSLLSIYESVSVLLISSFCSVDFTYE